MTRNLLPRHVFLVGALFATLAACAHDTKPYRPDMTLERVVAMLPSLTTESAVVAAFGPEDFSFRFLQQGPHDPVMNEYPREHWQVHATPANLIDGLPVGTKILAYGFTTIDALNPWQIPLFVYVADDGRVLGWSHEAVGYEREMSFAHH
jgi:hypothetical protein